MTDLKTFTIAALLGTALTACASVPFVGGEETFADRITEIAEDWEDGKEKVEKGRDRIDDGRDDIRDGEDDLREHTRRLADVQRELRRAQEAYDAGLLLASAGAQRDPNMRGAEMAEDENLKRLRKQVEKLEKDVREERDEIEDARDEIRDGEKKVRRGEELIREGEREMIEAETAYRQGGGTDPDFFERFGG